MFGFITAEHLHVAVNHIPLIGLGFAVIPLLYAIITRQRPALIIGLLMMLVSSAALPFLMESGEGAAGRLGSGDLQWKLDPDGTKWMAEHCERAEKAEILIYVVLAASAIGLIVLWIWRRWDRAISIAMLVLCVATIAVLLWVADAGGRIRHPEFRAAASGQQAPVKSGDR
jgi:hypothetical protein